MESSCASRGALVRQVVARLNTGLCCARGGFAQKEEEEARFRGLPLALASELCVWNGFCLGELGLLLTTVESDRRRRMVLLLPLSTALSDGKSSIIASNAVLSNSRYTVSLFPGSSGANSQKDIPATDSPRPQQTS